jgi:uncharacterized protein YhaN
VRLVTLRIRGFRRFRDTEVDCDHRRLLVVGPNEAGKSTLMECLLTGLFGLAPAKRGAGHHAALREATPWTGEGVGLSLAYRLDGGRSVEVDWDLSGERTQVIDHTGGDDITAEFAGGTHGWVDVGQAMLGVSATVFRQFTCVGEGELAIISDDAEIRESLLRLSDSGVDVLVEQAIARLDEAARQATIPKVNSATRRNQLEREMLAAQQELDRVLAARAGLDSEVHGIAETEAAIERLRDEVAGMMAEDERRQEEQRRLSTEIERAYGRLAEAELRRASLSADSDVPESVEAWHDEQIEAARQLLVSPEQAGRRRRLPLVAGVALVLAAVAAIATGLLLATLPLAGVGAALAAVGVLLLTRAGPSGTRSLKVGDLSFPSRAALMVALDHQRAQRELALQQAAVDDIQARLKQLLEPAVGADEGASPRRLQAALAEARVRQTELRLQLERQRTSLSVRSGQVGDVSALEERVATLQAQVAELEAFGAACRLAAQHLSQASEEIRRAYAPKLQAYLSRDLPRITQGRYSEAVVNDRFEVMVRAPETNQMVEMGRLSRGTQQQIYLLMRLGLLDIVGSRAERLPLFLDDALALSDDDRRAELLKVLEAEDRQVIYFTAQESAAEAAFGDDWHRVVLPGPGTALANGPELKVLDSPLA